MHQIKLHLVGLALAGSLIVPAERCAAGESPILATL